MDESLHLRALEEIRCEDRGAAQRSVEVPAGPLHASGRESATKKIPVPRKLTKCRPATLR